MSKIYLAVPLIANRNMNKAKLLSKTIENMGHEILSKWVTKADPGFALPPRKIFERDTKKVKECDILVAEISDLSHGVGMEIMLAYTQKTKTICLFNKGSIISRMIRGIPNVLLVEYSSEKELVEKLNTVLGRSDSDKLANDVEERY